MLGPPQCGGGRGTLGVCVRSRDPGSSPAWTSACSGETRFPVILSALQRWAAPRLLGLDVCPEQCLKLG